ncbi:MAG TPA: ABC transporter permease [Gemmataceae bacterium]|nr:ABC transporter permease [Gemmataceae bacterium]
MTTTRMTHAMRMGLRSLGAHRLRSVLTALGIILGVGSVIVMLAVGEAARAEALRQLEDLGANTILIRSVKPQDQPERTTGVDLLAFGITDDDLARIRGTIPTVVSAMPARESRRIARHRDRKLDARLLGVTPDFFRQHNLKIDHGRPITETDERRFENVAVLGAGAADVLFPGQDPVGKGISLDDIDGPRQYTVIGVTEPKTLAGATEAGANSDLNRVVFIPFATDRLRFGRDLLTWRTGSTQVEKLEISQITVTVEKTSDVKRTAAVIESLLDQYHPRKDVTVFVPLDLLQKAEQTQRLFTLVLGAIAGVSLVVGGIGIMNIMLATVTERTKEIGVRRAMGAKRRDIASQFLVETVILSCGGGLLGVAVGIGGAYLVTWLAELPVIIRVWSPLLAFGVSVLVGLVSGIYPARRAALLDPIEALRHE